MISKVLRPLSGLLFALILLASCRSMYPSIMFQIDDDDLERILAMDTTATRDTIVRQYTINASDRLNMQVFSNSGYEIVSVISGSTEGKQQNTNLFEYRVNQDGYVRLPLLDTVYVKGKTLSEMERDLGKRYATFFKDPFVIMKVVNWRVSVYLGRDKALVVPLENEQTSLPEVLAKAGGLSRTDKAYRIKIIRGDLSNPEIRIVDLSTIEGMKNSNLLVRANDIIYVETSTRVTAGVLQELNPVVGIVTSLFLIWDIYQRTRQTSTN